MAKYLVHKNPGSPLVVISLDGYGPTKGEGLTEIGSFELDVHPKDNQLVDPDHVNQNGDHLFVAKAREVLENHLGDNRSTANYRFEDRASNAVLTDETADFSTDALPATDGVGARDAEASTQAGGEKNAKTHEIHADTQRDGNKPDSTPGAQAAGETGGDTETEAEGSETVAKLKERIAGMTDKSELEREYKLEQEGKNRPTALKAIEDRAAELA